MDAWLRARRLAVVGLAGLAGACGLAHGAGADVIVDPPAGAFTEEPEITVSGAIPTPDVAGTMARLNGAPVSLTPGASLPDGSVEGLFSGPVALDFEAVFNPLEVDWTLPDGTSGRARSTVAAGPSVADGAASFDSAALRFNDSGLDDFEPALQDLVGFDLASVLPVGRRIYNKCLVDTFAGCLGRAKVYVDDPPPSYTGQRVSLDSFADGVQLDLALEGVRVDLEIRGSGLVPDCRLRLTADAVRIGGRFALAPDPTDASAIDLGQNDVLTIAFDAFHQNFTGGSCNDPLIEDAVNGVVGNLKSDIRNALHDLLDDPDGDGPADGPLADAIEAALAGVEIARPIGLALGVGLRSPIVAVSTDDDGVTITTDTIVEALPGDPAGCDAPADAPDFAASYDPPSALPGLGARTPQGLLPYDVALAVGDAALDQGLKAFTECGLLHSDLEQLTLGANTFPIDAGLLSLLAPAFGSLPPGLPLTIRVRPSLAPILAAGPGPAGELAALRIADLRIDVIDPSDGFVWLGMAVDATTGLDFAFDASTGQLSLATAGGLAGVSIAVVADPIGADEPALVATLTTLLEDGLVSLGDDLGSFRLPVLLGLELVPIEIDRQPGSATFYFDAALPVPEPSLELSGAAGLVMLAGLARRRRRGGPRGAAGCDD